MKRNYLFWQYFCESIYLIQTFTDKPQLFAVQSTGAATKGFGFSVLPYVSGKCSPPSPATRSFMRHEKR